MSRDIGELTRRYRTRGLLVDTNLLLLFLVGALDKQRVATFKRTQKFVPEDFDTLCEYMDLFEIRVTTPHVLTEVSNLAGNLGARAPEFFSGVFSRAIQILKEHHVHSRDLVERAEFPKFGLTDCAIMDVVKGKYLLLTDDLKLSQWFNNSGGDSVNFNHIRPAGWKL